MVPIREEERGKRREYYCLVECVRTYGVISDVSESCVFTHDPVFK